MKKPDLFFTTISLPFDYLGLLIAAVAAYVLRFSDFVVARRPVIFYLPFDQFFRFAALVALGWIVLFGLSGLYTMRGRRKKFDEIKKIILAATAALGGELAIVVFTREMFESRFILLASYGFAIFFIILLRFVLRAFRSLLHYSGIGLKPVVIIGQTSSAAAVAGLLENTPRLGFKVLLYAKHFDEECRAKLADLVKNETIDQIIYLNQNGGSKGEIQEVLDFADEYHISFKYSADILATHGAGLEFDTLAGVPTMEVKRTRLEGWGRVYKRTFDIVGAFLLIIIISPIMLLAAIMVVLSSGFPIFYYNERAGERGLKFCTLKFRTMYKKFCVTADNPEALKLEADLIKKQNIKQGPVYKIKNDPRITRVGKILRKTSIDELPQLFNVLVGQMSLVGPRPHQPREVDKYEKHHKRVLAIRPGITGLSQISGRSDLSFEEEVRLDVYYIEQWSLKLDFIILIKTIGAVLSQKGTY